MFLQSFFDTSFNPRTIGGRFIPQKQSSGHDTNRTNSEKLWAATVFPNEFRDAVGRHSLSERIQKRCGTPQSFRTNSGTLRRRHSLLTIIFCFTVKIDNHPGFWGEGEGKFVSEGLVECALPPVGQPTVSDAPT